ncbi:MAG: putative bifunctional diguanylate cyclase/phosphodiesterase [Rhizobiaceae bacterium]
MKRSITSALGIALKTDHERSQVFFEKFKVTASLVPSLMLGNIFLASIAFLSLASFPFEQVKTLAYLVTCIICFISLVLWRKTSIEALRSSRSVVKQSVSLPFKAISLALGCLWALLPPSLLVLTGAQELVVAAATLAGILCVAGFALVPIPSLAVLFLTPVLMSCYATLWVSGATHGLILALALSLYVAFIATTAISNTRSMVKAILAGNELAKQQKTISLLLRDFEKHTSDWLWEIDHNSKFVRVFDRFSEVAGRTAEELETLTLSGLVSSESDSHPATGILLGAIQKRVAFTEMQIPVQVRGNTFWWSMTGNPDFDENGVFVGYHGVGSDITLQKKADERINFLAHHDALTGLFNRAHFTELLNQNVSRLERYGAPFALMFLDLDYFKTVNDTFGHPTGDKLLIEVANRLRKVAHPSASIARLGGDEFAVIFQKSIPAPELQQTANAILQTISQPFEIDGERLQIGVSIGAALAPHHGTRPDQLLRNVDLALYRAKESGRNVFRVFESGMDSLARERRALEFDLRYALDGNELELVYQPLVGAEDNKPTGFEALLRWNHPIRGTISPVEFVPIAESTGLIKSIGEWVIREACRVAATWPDNLTVAVNLSAPQFNKDRIVDVVADALVESGLRPDRLELEITESLLIERPDEAIATLVRLKELGVSIAMDDFGTGYSSLSYLLKFPFDKIKIDKSFISAIDTDKAACDVLRTIGSLGKSLNVRITAEGVETAEQAEFLRAIACDQLQGYFFAKPLHVNDVAGFLVSLTHRNMSADVRPLPSKKDIVAA